MRRFWLENQSGAIWDLTSNDLAAQTANFMYAPQGLGIRTRVGSFAVENTYFIEQITTQTQNIQGVLIFSDYPHFTRFVNFVGNINTEIPLRLYYSTDGSTHQSADKQWYKEVLITDLRKEEIDIQYAALRIPITFSAISRWKRDVEITLELARTGTPLTFPYVYPYFFGGSNNMAVQIDNTGNLPTSARVRVEGITDTPLFRIVRDGEILNQAKYHLTVGATQHLIVDSDPARQEATLYTRVGNNTVREDVYNAGEADYTFANFISIPSGVSWFLASATNANFGRVTISYSILKELH